MDAQATAEQEALETAPSACDPDRRSGQAVSPTSRSHPQQRDRWLVPVALLYLFLAALMTWPVAANLSSMIAGEGVDIYSHLWTFHWVRDALLSGQSPYFTTQIFYPTGVSLANHNIAWLQILLWIPLQAVLGSIAAYNMLFLVVLAANGAAMYLLAREILGNRAVAFVSGLIFAFWPYVLTQNEHPNFLFVAWVPLALLFSRRTVQKQRFQPALLAGICLALTGWVRWQLLVIAAIPVTIYGLALLWPQSWTDRQKSVHWLLLAGGVTAVLLLPIAIPVATYQLRRDNPEDLYLDEHAQKQTDLLAYVTPSPLHPLWDSTLTAVFGPFHDNFDIQNQQRRPFLGYSVLLLALVGAVAAYPHSRTWSFMAVVLVLLALGPILRINGVLYPEVPMPYRLLADNPLLRLLRLTDRINILLGLPISLLAGFGCRAILQKVKRPSRQTALVGVISVLVLAEYAAFPYPVSSTAVPAWLAELEQQPDDFALLHLPNHEHEFNKFYMYYQTVHGQPLVNGKVARIPREALASWEEVPLLAELQSEAAVQIKRQDIGRQLSLLHEADVRYIVLHKALAAPGQMAAWRDWLTMTPIHEDEQLVVYTTNPTAGQEYELTTMLTPEIGLVRWTVNPDTAVANGIIKVDARLGSRAAASAGREACLQLRDETNHIVQVQCQVLPGPWQANDLWQMSAELPVETAVPPGQYKLTWQAATESNFEATVLGTVTVEAYTPEATAQVNWADKISLPAYDFALENEALHLTFYWQAEAAMNQSYKFFVHLVDPASGEVVAQVDAAPRGWSYLTTAWAPGERVHETVVLSLADVPAGTYDLSVGWYDEATGIRLTAVSNPNTPAETAVLLTQITVP
ncbi:MAG: hypothetical protein CL608_07690 [Anaerolineaceae bacterium]|nr:hypothetical protein [Anaerolineaceae bacterium]